MNDCLAPQQSLRSGDIIVAIARRLLVDLSEDDVEEHFGAEFTDGASLVVGSFEAGEPQVGWVRWNFDSWDELNMNCQILIFGFDFSDAGQEEKEARNQ